MPPICKLNALLILYPSIAEGASTMNSIQPVDSETNTTSEVRTLTQSLYNIRGPRCRS